MRPGLCVKRRERGSFMLGFAGLTAVLAILCATVLMRSMETYRTSALAVQKLQARAAAEGAAVAWSRGSLAAGNSVSLGECVATLDSATSGSAGMDVRLSVAVHPQGSKTAALKSRYVAAADATQTGAYQIRSMELAP